MEKGDIEQLNQLLSTLEEYINKMEIAYSKEDYANFDKIKRLSLGIFNQISEITQ